MPFDPPSNLTPADEYRHPKPEGAEGLLYGDTLWVSVVDPAAGIHGVIHFHLTNNGFARFESLFVIDGVVQLYGNKIPHGSAKPDNGAVVRRSPHATRSSSPGSTSRSTLDWEGLRLRSRLQGPLRTFRLRTTALPKGDPLARIGPFHGGHYEQAMDCTGRFEIRRGPNAGDVRQRSRAGAIATTAGRIASPAPQKWRGSRGPLRVALLAFDPAARPPHQRLRQLLREHVWQPEHKAVGGLHLGQGRLAPAAERDGGDLAQ